MSGSPCELCDQLLGLGQWDAGQDILVSLHGSFRNTEGGKGLVLIPERHQSPWDPKEHYRLYLPPMLRCSHLWGRTWQLFILTLLCPCTKCRAGS